MCFSSYIYIVQLHVLRQVYVCLRSFNIISKHGVIVMNKKLVKKCVVALSAMAMLSGLAPLSALAVDGISYHAIDDDATSEILSTKTYTHAVDFGSDSTRALVNGVQFQAGGTTFGSIAGTSATVGTGTTTIPTAHAGNTAADPYLNGASACAMRDWSRI